MPNQQLTIYDEIRRRELQEAQAEEEAVFTGPVQAGPVCLVCGEPITPKGWCPCKARKTVQEITE